MAWTLNSECKCKWPLNHISPAHQSDHCSFVCVTFQGCHAILKLGLIILIETKICFWVQVWLFMQPSEAQWAKLQLNAEKWNSTMEMLFQTTSSLLLQSSMASLAQLLSIIWEVEVARLTDLSRLAGTLAFLPKSISYLFLWDSAGCRDMLSVTSLSPSCGSLQGAVPTCRVDFPHPVELGTCLCCASFLTLFWTPHWGRNRKSRWQVWGVTARKTMKSSRLYLYLWGLYCLWLQMLCTVAAHQGEITGYDSTKWIYFKYPSVYKNNWVG